MINKVYIPELSRASYTDYAEFVQAYLEAGGKARLYEGDLYDIFITDLFIARENCHVPEAYGAQAVKVVVPEGVNVTTGGHNTLFRMDDPLIGRPRVKIDSFVAKMLRCKGLTLEAGHFIHDENDREFFWQLDRLNGHGLMARFKRAHDNNRLDGGIVRTRLQNFGRALDRLCF